MNLCDLLLFTGLDCISVFIIKSVHLFVKNTFYVIAISGTVYIVYRVMHLLPYLCTSLVYKFSAAFNLVLTFVHLWVCFLHSVPSQRITHKIGRTASLNIHQCSQIGHSHNEKVQKCTHYLCSVCVCRRARLSIHPFTCVNLYLVWQYHSNMWPCM